MDERQKLVSAYVQTVVGTDSPPVGAMMDFAGSVEPSGWVFCFGQAYPRAGAMAQLFSVIGTTWGAPDGSSFNVPDFRGRTRAGKDDMGGTAANRLTSAWGVNGAVLGANGGSESIVLTVPQIPSHTHSYTTLSSGATIAGGSGAANVASTSGSTGGGLGHSNVQPTGVVNVIIKYIVSGTVLPIVPGTGDVTGPDGGVADGDLAVYFGTSGKVLRGGVASSPVFFYNGLMYRPSGLIYVNTTQSVNSGATETVLATFTIPAGFLARDGDTLRVHAAFAGVNDTTSKTVSIKFGGQVVHSHTVAVANSLWSFISTITRTGVTGERYSSQASYEDSANFLGRVATAAGTVDLASSVAITINGTGTASSKVFHNRSQIEFLPVT